MYDQTINSSSKKIVTQLNDMTAVLGISFSRVITEFLTSHGNFFIEGKFADQSFCLMRVEYQGGSVYTGEVEYNDNDELLLVLSYNDVIVSNLNRVHKLVIEKEQTT